MRPTRLLRKKSLRDLKDRDERVEKRRVSRAERTRKVSGDSLVLIQVVCKAEREREKGLSCAVNINFILSAAKDFLIND